MTQQIKNQKEVFIATMLTSIKNKDWPAFVGLIAEAVFDEESFRKIIANMTKSREYSLHTKRFLLINNGRSADLKIAEEQIHGISSRLLRARDETEALTMVGSNQIDVIVGSITAFKPTLNPYFSYLHKRVPSIKYVIINPDSDTEQDLGENYSRSQIGFWHIPGSQSLVDLLEEMFAGGDKLISVGAS